MKHTHTWTFFSGARSVFVTTTTQVLVVHKEWSYLFFVLGCGGKPTTATVKQKKKLADAKPTKQHRVNEWKTCNIRNNKFKSNKICILVYLHMTSLACDRVSFSSFLSLFNPPGQNGNWSRALWYTFFLLLIIIFLFY